MSSTPGPQGQPEHTVSTSPRPPYQPSPQQPSPHQPSPHQPYPEQAYPAQPYPGAPTAGAYPVPFGGQPQPAGYPGQHPGSLAWVEQNIGRVASFGERAAAAVVDGLLSLLVMLPALIAGGVAIGAGVPDQEPCSYTSSYSCDVPGTGDDGLIGLGLLIISVGMLLPLALWLWNRVWRVSKTGQSIGRKVVGLRVANSESGRLPTFGEMFLRELLRSFITFINAIWMLFDADKRTLGDIVGKTTVVKTR